VRRRRGILIKHNDELKRDDQTHRLVAPTQRGPQDQRDASATGGGRLRVLLVEDDEADAFLVHELLDEAAARVELSVATTLAQARESIRGVDCVLLDLGLPDAQGLDGLRELLAIADGAAVCVLTGLGDDKLGSEAVAEGAQDYLIKGQVDGVLLARSLRYAVERRRADENARRLHEAEILEHENRRLQRGLLPQPILRTDTVRVHTFYQPGRHSSLLGGDFYDVVQTAPDRLLAVVGDVSGHGVDEAALGVALRVAWRALILAGVADDAVLPALEQVLISERRHVGVFATLAMVTLDLTGAEASVRLAGHPPPLVLGDGEAQVAPAAYGRVLGVFETSEWSATAVPLAGADWTLLMYTDGLVEGRFGEGRLGIDRLCSLVTSRDGQAVGLSDLPAWLVARAEEANGGPLADDVAILALAPGRRQWP
jgi:serine phosphatase RsbU (regulator of sigma subunit)